jgi:glutathione S-transferase
MWGALRDIGGRTMSDEFRSLDERERAALEAALKRCRVLADQIESILRNESPHFVDRVSLADFYASIQRAADVLGQESRKSVENTPAPAVDSRARGRQRHR